MELGSKGPDSNGHCETASMMHLLSEEDSPGGRDLFGVPKIAPRVGDDYQVEIPALLTDSEYESYGKNPIEEELDSNIVPFDFVLGLPVPVMWIDKNMKPDDLVVEEKTDRKMVPKSLGNGCSLVPGECADTWTKAEVASFILGLFIFGKNLVQVKRFLDNKTMGAVLSFYYGKFYRSDGYCRWSEGRKMRSRKFVHGHRIFAGSRQQELLSRLSSHVSGEVQSTLSQVSKSYGEGKMSMEEYVSILKAMVGLKNLVEAVGIGKGKQDLTRTYLEPSKSNNSNAARSDVMVPAGKACSSLTPAEIVSFLTGDFRLSKARTNDLFWEAVWPRLLARGWHSEQPKDYNYAATMKDPLLFLLPGIMKFNRRRLLKGKDFYDSIKDVLNKVALDPSLLQLDNEETNDVQPQQQQQQCCYLQPRTQIEKVESIKFTVVDTSMAPGKLFKIRELKASPTEKLIISPYPNDSEKIEGTSGTSSEETDSKPASRPFSNPKKRSNTIKRPNGDNSDTVAKKGKKLASRTSTSMKTENHLHGKRISSTTSNCNETGFPNFNFAARTSHKKAEPSQTVIDLNIPHPPPTEPACKDTRNSHKKAEPSQPVIDLNIPQLPPTEPACKDTKDGVVSNTTEDMNPRRHSTRNRPPTMRALEAHANGYLKIGNKKMDKGATSRPKLTSSSATTPNSSRLCQNGRKNENDVPTPSPTPNVEVSKTFFASNATDSTPQG